MDGQFSGMPQVNRSALNQPFEFQEALLSFSERSRVQQAPLRRHLLDEAPERVEVRDYRLRAFSIRLRTINNACDAVASLPGGLPLTEVSIYGSRDRHYLVGPYPAIKQLMAGWVPSRTCPFPEGGAYGRQKSAELNAAARRIADYIARVEAGERVQRVYLGSLLGGTSPGNMVQFWSQDLEFLKEAHTSLLALTGEFPPTPEGPKRPLQWWMDWTPPGEEDRQAIDDVISRAREVLSTLESQAFAPG
jgi:hypothetical protein